MLEFTVGKDFPLGDCRGKEGFFFDYGETGIASLTIVFKHMRPLEVDLITREHGRIGLFMYSGIIFVSCKFGRIDGDNAYTVHLHERPEEIFVPKAEEGTGIPPAYLCGRKYQQCSARPESVRHEQQVD